MWTDRHQTRHEARLKNMVLQTGLDEVARFLERADPPGRPEAIPARRVLAAIAWHLRVGGAWRALPAGFPPWRSVYGWFRRWIDKGLFESLMRALARRQRRRCGRRSEPRLAIIDTQSVKCISVRGPRGYDAAKKVVGRKRVALVDAEGHVLALAVLPANVQDRDTLPTLDDGKEQWPSLRLAILDGTFAAERCQDWCNIHGMRRRIVEKEPDQKGFVVLKRRWVVERTFCWLSHWAGLHRERAGRLDVATGRLACVASLMAANALYNPV
ncbi:MULTISPECIES: IS5 family transposase [unclassified Methylobacterium]|uniref:IS5 family transposase n=1 Tax=unclassified Methylobacterium TaxID=2615210 RepID=UPI0011C1D6CD|nr:MULTISPECIES: IS5 family transposase [unclassified Methylobacterium]QEE39033.1 IS5 family transposase [Methylobacterium sp. WL1]TXN54172.1 IS5 family transposase [Methylobacterium sp. WL2]